MKQILTDKTKALMGIKGDIETSDRLDQEAESLEMVMKDPVNGTRNIAIALGKIIDNMPKGADTAELERASANFTAVSSRLQDAVRLASDALKNAAADLRKTETD